MDIKEIRSINKLTQKEFATKYGIPLQTVKNWESKPTSKSYRKCPNYVANQFFINELKDCCTTNIYIKAPNTFKSNIEWLTHNCPKNTALCKRSMLLYNGYIVGNINEDTIKLCSINDKCINDDDIYYTDFSTTINDMIIDSPQYDQDIAEALSNYYERNNHSFKGIDIYPFNQKYFDEYCEWALEYHEV